VQSVSRNVGADLLALTEAVEVMEEPNLRSLPAGAGSKPPRAALAEDRCREHRGKRLTHVVCQVRAEKASTSEPSLRCRN